MKDSVIQNLLVEASKIFKVDIYSNCRQEQYILARAVVYSIMRDCLNMTYQQIGKVFNKNHATIMHAYNELPYMIKYNKSLAEKKVELLKTWGENYHVKRYTKHSEQIKDLQERIFLLNLESRLLQNQLDTLQKHTVQ
tara:strand:+ start:27 stop:440 length:414 start_codon:yes stop_codon:yes gene_type:complete